MTSSNTKRGGRRRGDNKKKDAVPAEQKKKVDRTPLRRTESGEHEREDFMKACGFQSTHCSCCGVDYADTNGYLVQCARCKSTYYCGTKCMHADYDRHSQYCGLVQVEDYTYEQAVEVEAENERVYLENERQQKGGFAAAKKQLQGSDTDSDNDVESTAHVTDFEEEDGEDDDDIEYLTSDDEEELVIVDDVDDNEDEYSEEEVGQAQEGTDEKASLLLSPEVVRELSACKSNDLGDIGRVVRELSRQAIGGGSSGSKISAAAAATTTPPVSPTPKKNGSKEKSRNASSPEPPLSPSSRDPLRRTKSGELERAEYMTKCCGFSDVHCTRCGTDFAENFDLPVQCARCKKATYCSTACLHDDATKHSEFCGYLKKYAQVDANALSEPVVVRGGKKPVKPEEVVEEVIKEAPRVRPPTSMRPSVVRGHSCDDDIKEMAAATRREVTLDNEEEKPLENSTLSNVVGKLLATDFSKQFDKNGRDVGRLSHTSDFSPDTVSKLTPGKLTHEKMQLHHLSYDSPSRFQPGKLGSERFEMHGDHPAGSSPKLHLTPHKLPEDRKHLEYELWKQLSSPNRHMVSPGKIPEERKHLEYRHYHSPTRRTPGKLRSSILKMFDTGTTPSFLQSSPITSPRVRSPCFSTRKSGNAARCPNTAPTVSRASVGLLFRDESENSKRSECINKPSDMRKALQAPML